MLSEISQPEPQILHVITYMWNLKKKKFRKQTVEKWLPGLGEIEMGKRVDFHL